MNEEEYDELYKKYIVVRKEMLMMYVKLKKFREENGISHHNKKKERKINKSFVLKFD